MIALKSYLEMRERTSSPHIINEQLYKKATKGAMKHLAKSLGSGIRAGVLSLPLANY